MKKILEELALEARKNEEFKEAGKELARTALTVTKTVRNVVDTVLNPIASVHSGYAKAREYFEKSFLSDLQQKTASIPEVEIVEPKPSIAAPVLAGLAFAHEEQDLKDMYLNLLATAMDGRKRGQAHPAFVEIIKQLDAQEAHLLQVVLSPLAGDLPVIPIIAIDELLNQSGTYNRLIRNILCYQNDESKEMIEDPRLPAMIDNWVRLGLIEVSYRERMSDTRGKNPYYWAESRPEYSRLKAEADKKGKKIKWTPGVLTITSFGVLFAQAVGLVANDAPRKSIKKANLFS